MFHRAKSVKTLPEYVLLVSFTDGADRLYDMKKLFEQYPIYRSFEDIPGLFGVARVDTGGYGIVWNEEIDIDAEEIYVNGVFP